MLVSSALACQLYDLSLSAHGVIQIDRVMTQRGDGRELFDVNACDCLSVDVESSLLVCWFVAVTLWTYEGMLRAVICVDVWWPKCFMGVCAGLDGDEK